MIPKNTETNEPFDSPFVIEYTYPDLAKLSTRLIQYSKGTIVQTERCTSCGNGFDKSGWDSTNGSQLQCPVFSLCSELMRGFNNPWESTGSGAVQLKSQRIRREEL